jgi:hypothetical protein
MAFNYDDVDVDESAIASLAAEISGGGLAPLSDEQRLERERWLRESRQNYQKQQAVYEQEQAAKVEQEKAEWLIEHRKAEAARQRERMLTLAVRFVTAHWQACKLMLRARSGGNASLIVQFATKHCGRRGNRRWASWRRL